MSATVNNLLKIFCTILLVLLRVRTYKTNKVYKIYVCFIDLLNHRLVCTSEHFNIHSNGQTCTSFCKNNKSRIFNTLLCVVIKTGREIVMPIFLLACNLFELVINIKMLYTLLSRHVKLSSTGRQYDNIWAASWQNQHELFATSVDPDQPALPRSLISIHAVCMYVCS
jgi:hypothetical protein